VQLVNISAVSGDEHYLRQQVLKAAGIPVLVGVFMQLFVPSLVIELVLQPLMFLLAGVSIVSDKKGEYQVKKFANNVLGLAFIALAAYVVVMAATKWSRAGHRILLNFALPLWLSLGVLPLVYVIGVYGAYEHIFVMWNIGTNLDSHQPRHSVRLALVLSFHLKAHELSTFVNQRSTQLRQVNSFREARRVVHDYRARRPETE
jgi:uncharacterized membrane protein YidH (DUF202 family)